MKKMKLLVITAFAILLSLTFVKLNNALAASSGDYVYTVTNGKATITRYNGTDTVLVIPSVIDSYPITEIADYSFSSTNGLESITLPDTLESIGSGAFINCRIVNYSISPINASFKTQNGVLYNKTMTKLIAYPGGYKGSASFVIPSTVKSIGDYAFYQSRLEKITIPGSVVSIGENAFGNNIWLQSVTIPSSVSAIGSCAFESCLLLPAINVDAGNATYASKNGILYNKSMTTLIACPSGINGSPAFPNSLTKISEYAFSYCKILTVATIPNSVTHIGDSAFIGCDNLSSIKLPAKLKSIGGYVFAYCNSLKDIIIPEGVTSIGYSAFTGSDNLLSVTIPNSVISIDDNAFNGCGNLTIYGHTGSFAQSYAKAEGIVFKVINEAELVITSVTVNKITASVGTPITWTANTAGGSGEKTYRYLLYKQNKLLADSKFGTTNTYTDIINDAGTYQVKAYVKDDTGTVSALSGNVIIKQDYTYKVSNGKATITHYGGEDVIVYIPSKLEGYPVVSIGANAFYNCNDVKSIIIPDSVTTIEDDAFVQCGVNKLTNITIPGSVTSIGDSAFFLCNKLTSIILPNRLISIGNQAFGSCYNLKSITIPASVKSLGWNAFYDCTSLTNINVASKNSAYRSKDGILYNKSFTKLISYPSGKSDKSFSIPDGIEIIGKDAFEAGGILETIDIPRSVKELGNDLLFFYSSFKDIKVAKDNAVYSSANGVLYNKAQKRLISYPAKKPNKSFSVPSNVTSIGKCAFFLCQNLEIINIPDSVIKIEGSAFDRCLNLKSIMIPSSVRSIGEYAFNGCKKLTIYGAANSYAQKFAKKNKIPFKVADSVMLAITDVSADMVTSATGIPITWTVKATGGSGAKTYRFLLYKDGKLLVTGKFGTSKTYKYTPTKVGVYKVRVYVKDSTGTVSMNSGNVTVKGPLAILSVMANKTTANIGTAITWTTKTEGGEGKKTYRFLLYKDGKLLVTGKFGTSKTYKYTPTEVGVYKVRAYVKDSTGTVEMKSKNVTVK